MKSKTITVTSKNQITLPAEFVKELGLSRGCPLTATKKGNTIELRPQPELEDRMQKYWHYAANKMQRPLSEGEIHSAARDAYAGKK